MPDSEFFELTTNRLRLEPFADHHSKGVFALWSNAEVCRYSGEAHDWAGRPIALPARSSLDSDKILDFFMRRAAEGSGVRWAVISKQTDRLIGAVGFNAITPTAELAYHFHPDHWGSGYATEACSVVVAWCRSKRPDAAIEAFVEAENPASIRLIRRLGFEKTTTLRDGAQRYVKTERHEIMSQNPNEDDEERLLSGEAWRDFCDRLKATGEAILQDGFPTAPGDRAEGFRWLTRLVSHATQLEVEAGDRQFPCFIRYETPHNQWGGPNPDNTYFRANLNPSCDYRVWGNVKDVRQAIFSLNEGEMQLGEYGVFSERSLDQFEVDEQGMLEIWITREEHSGNWIPSDPKGRLLTIRIFQSDWVNDAAHPFHIERIGAEGIARPPLTAEYMTRALDRSARWIEKTGAFWNQYTNAGWNRATPNQIAPAKPAPGGADNILYGSCFFELREDQAMVIECDPPDAEYWGWTIHTMAWLESGDFADRQTSLSGHQVHLDSDGVMRIVLSQRDPGVANWIDLTGRERGLLVYRWVWSKDNPMPTSTIMALDQVRAAMPADHPIIDDGARRKSLSRRREAAWNRYL